MPAAEKSPCFLRFLHGLLVFALCKVRAGQRLQSSTLSLQVLAARTPRCWMCRRRGLLEVLPPRVQVREQRHDPGLTLLVLQVSHKREGPLGRSQCLKGAVERAKVLPVEGVRAGLQVEVGLAHEEQGLHLHLPVQGDLGPRQRALRGRERGLPVAVGDVRPHQRLGGGGLAHAPAAKVPDERQRLLRRLHCPLGVLLLELPERQALGFERLEQCVTGFLEEFFGLDCSVDGVLVHLLQGEGHPNPVKGQCLARLLP
mmetsp:Transcript_131375/g.366282  ORF Transcript_131375/g.366282 Transcript_131375/m.366282 type:complete len:257 (+) Transcript_131375:1180-1950(+)